MNDSDKFYFKNFEKVNSLLEIRNQTNLTIINNAYDYINSHFSDVIKWGRSQSGYGTFNVYPPNLSGAYFYINFEGLRVTIRLWVNGELSGNLLEINDERKREISDKYLTTGDEEIKLGSSGYIVEKNYSISLEQIDEYHCYIVDLIAKEWLTLVKALFEEN